MAGRKDVASLMCTARDVVHVSWCTYYCMLFCSNVYLRCSLCGRVCVQGHP